MVRARAGLAGRGKRGAMMASSTVQAMLLTKKTTPTIPAIDAARCAAELLIRISPPPTVKLMMARAT